MLLAAGAALGAAAAAAVAVVLVVTADELFIPKMQTVCSVIN